MRRSLLHGLLIACLLSILLPLGKIAHADAPPLSTAERSALESIGAALAPIPNRVDSVLNAVGFAPVARTIPGYHKWPVLRKIETAYLAVVAQGGHSDGEKFLRTVSHIIAEDHSSAIRYERGLARYFSGPDRTAHTERARFAFKLDLKAPAPTALATRQTILILAQYAEGVPGGIQGVMERCCNNSPDEVYQILRSSDSPEDALIRAVQEGHPPPQIKGRIIQMIRDVAASSHALYYEPALQPYLAALEPSVGGPSGLLQPHYRPAAVMPVWTPTDESKLEMAVGRALRQSGAEKRSAAALLNLLAPNDGSGMVTPAPSPGNRSQSTGRGSQPSSEMPVSPSPGTAQANLLDYRAIQRSVLSGAPAAPEDVGASPTTPLPHLSFSVMRASNGGFGGVLFGNKIDTNHIPHPKAVFWVPDPAEGNSVPKWGHFDVVFPDNTVRPTRRMRAEDAYAGWEILAGRKGVVPALDVRDGEGVGLASLGPDHAHMVVHPALYGFGLGDSAVMADAIGFELSPERLRQRLKDVGATASVIDAAVDWRKADTGWYKIIDAPTIIEIRDGLVRVQSAVHGNYPNRLRDVAFLNFQALGSADRAEVSNEFYSALPALITAFPAFERLNSFAETFAIERWAEFYHALVSHPRQPERHKLARLFVYEDSAGDLQQFTHELSTNDQGALALSTLRRQAAMVSGTLRANGAPHSALSRLNAVVEKLQQVVLLDIAGQRLLDVVNQTHIMEEQVSELNRATEMRREAIRHAYSTPAGIYEALCDSSTAAALHSAHSKSEEAAAASYASRDKLNQVIWSEYQAVRNQTDQMLEARNQYYQAGGDQTQREKAKRNFKAAAARLDGLLAHVSDKDWDHAQANVVYTHRASQKARAVMEAVERQQVPEWLKASLASVTEFMNRWTSY